MIWGLMRAVSGGVVVLMQCGIGSAQTTEIVARRECLQAIREQGVRGFALERPRFTRAGESASLSGQMVQGSSRLDFNCMLDRRGKVTDLTVARPVSAP
ncbi:hypothetical protein [Neoroseomonas soli]|uniref:Uncharacterized protein n=1 Tax=Neoroseomonas soli TaxID=1081025 RepID=A0A9X9WW04_9PROT|nr:hypothetical protein [Neoroseomonas soli]MBR0671333.1 hypothetical protein [Neoroseomonas soli]